jgi:hypothetical protein
MRRAWNVAGIVNKADIASVRGQASEIARGWSAPGAPESWALTAAVFDALAGDDALLAVAADVPADKLPALLFCASACYLIADREPERLIDYFPTAGGPQPTVDAAFEPAFRAFCLDHRDELAAVCARRRYQMNDVARTTQVALALGVIGRRRPAAKIALIDLGSGAGFGLHPDRYWHLLGAGRPFGNARSQLTLRCESDGPLPVPPRTDLPSIESRTGVDLEPIDLADPDDRRWARACLPPETHSLDRFDQAARIVAAHPGRVRRGDAVEELPAILDAVGDDVLPVVIDTYTAVFFSDEQRGRLLQLVQQRGDRGDLAWISLDPLVPLGVEGRYSVQGLDVPGELVTEYQRDGVFALLGLLSFEQGRRHGSLLARAHPSGTSVRWLDEATSGGP